MKRNEKILLGVGVGGVLLWAIMRNKETKFGPLVPFQRIRGTDAHGSGAFGASRGDRLHNGIDIIANPGQAIKSPVDGTIKRYSDPYGDRAFSGYHILTDDYLIKIWYLAPNQAEGTRIKRGQVIGFAQNIAARYPGITPHVHIEVWDLTKNNVAINPSKLF